MKRRKVQEKVAQKTLNELYPFIVLYLFYLWLSISVNSYGHVEMLPPFYGTSTQHQDVTTPKMCLNE